MDKTLVNSKLTLVFSLLQEHQNPGSHFVTGCLETHLIKNAEDPEKTVL